MKKADNILLTGFRGSSAQILLRYAEGYQTLLLPNDKVRDFEKLKSALEKERFDCIFSFGQRPLIKDKAHIETTAKDGNGVIHTDFDCTELSALFAENGITAKISHNAGISYCNSLYYHSLRYIRENALPTQMVFIHIPFMKNIGHPDMFFKQILNAIEER